MLTEHLARREVAVERGAELVGLERDGRYVACSLRHEGGAEEVVTARYVVGCDGAHSAVRNLTGIAFEGRAYPQTFLLADLEVDGLEPGGGHVYLTGSGCCSCCRSAFRRAGG
ncbi:FAD-dependent monooxygenase [Streptomyces sp. M19]